MPTLNIITNGAPAATHRARERQADLGRPNLRPPNTQPQPHTPVPGNGVDLSDTLKALSAAVAAATGKPESYVLVSARADVPLLFGGTEAPAAYGELLSIGAIGGDKNKAISRAVADVVTARLGVPANRFYLSFHDAARSDFGWNGGTF
jgi:phenylpyruvate tautomerase